MLEEGLVYLLVHILLDLRRVHDAHVHARLAGVVQKRGVEPAAHGLVAAEGKREVGHAPRNLTSGAQTLDLASGVDEVDGVVVVLLHTSTDGQDVGIEDDILGVEANLLDEELVRAHADAHLLSLGSGLALFVERHHHDSGAVALDNRGVLQELLLATLERDGVHDALALAALQTGLDDVELRRVDHERDLAHVGLGNHEVHEARHRGLAVDEAVVHVDVDDVGTVLDLLEGDRESLLVVAVDDGLLENRGARDVAALTEVDERLAVVADVGVVVEGLQAGEAHEVLDGVLLAGLELRHHLGELADVVLGGTAAAADGVDQALFGEHAAVTRHLVALLVVATHGVGEPGVGVAEHPAVSSLGQVFDVGNHVLGAESAVKTDRDGLGVGHGVPERFVGLAGESAAGVVHDGTGDEDGNLLAPVREELVDGEHRSLGVQGVEDGLNQQHVNATVDERLHLFVVRGDDLVVGAPAECGVLHGRRHGKRLVRGAHRTRGEAGPRGVLLGHRHAALLGELRRDLVQVVHDVLLVQLVIKLRDHRGVERVRFDDVRPSLEVLHVDLLHNVGAGDHQDVVVALQVVGVVLEPLAPEVFFLELVRLHRGAHGAVDDHDPFLHDLVDHCERGGGLDRVDPRGVLGHGSC